MISRRDLLTTAAAGAAGLVAAACSGDDDSTPPPATTAPDLGSDAADDDGADLAPLIGAIAAGYDRTRGVWTGFDPADHPAVVLFRTGGATTGVLAINHDAPDQMGVARPVSTDGTSLRSAHVVSDLTDETAERLDRVQNFEFNADLGGVDSFVMVSDADDDFLNSEQPDWVATYLHEMFHRYQGDAFEGGLGGQDVDGYDYSPANLRLAVLEDRALADAIGAEDETGLEIAARRFAAIRLTRRAADDRIGLDDRQEMFEGTARALEHLQAGDETSFAYHAGNWARDLVTDLPTSGVKDLLGFGRFYASGAAIQRVATRLGVSDLATRVEAGEFLADLLVDHVEVTASEADGLVTEAEQVYDPDGTLLAEAERASEIAAEEAPVFGEETGADGGEPGSGDAESFVLTDEQVACLDEADVGDDGEISDDVFERCIGG